MKNAVFVSFILTMIFTASSLCAQEAFLNTADVEAVPFSLNACKIQANPGEFAKVLAQQYQCDLIPMPAYQPGEGEFGALKAFREFFSSKQATMLTPVVKLEYDEGHSCIVQCYEDGPTGIKVAIQCPDGDVRVMESGYTEMLAISYSCYGSPLENMERHLYGKLPYYTQRFISLCKKYQSEIYLFPLDIKNYGDMAGELELLGICYTGNLFQPVAE